MSNITTIVLGTAAKRFSSKYPIIRIVIVNTTSTTTTITVKLIRIKNAAVETFYLLPDSITLEDGQMLEYESNLVLDSNDYIEFTASEDSTLHCSITTNINAT